MILGSASKYVKIIKSCELEKNETKWFPAKNINFLCQQINDMIICRDILPDADKKEDLYNAIYEFDGNLFLVPWRARQILVYNIDSSRYVTLENDELKIWSEQDNKYATSFMWKKYLYLFGFHIPYIVKVNMYTYEITILTNLVGERIKRLEELLPANDCFFSNNYVLHAGAVWVPMVGKIAMVELQLDSDSMYLHEFPIGRSYTICENELDTFWLYISRQNSIVKWHREKGILDKFIDIDIQHDESAFISLNCENNILKCKNAEECVYININTRQRTKEKRHLQEVFMGGMWDETMAHNFFGLMKDDILKESGLQFMNNPLQWYVECADSSDVLLQSKESGIGKKIFQYIRKIKCEK